MESNFDVQNGLRTHLLVKRAKMGNLRNISGLGIILEVPYVLYR